MKFYIRVLVFIFLPCVFSFYCQTVSLMTIIKKKVLKGKNNNVSTTIRISNLFDFMQSFINTLIRYKGRSSRRVSFGHCPYQDAINLQETRPEGERSLPPSTTVDLNRGKSRRHNLLGSSLLTTSLRSGSQLRVFSITTTFFVFGYRPRKVWVVDFFMSGQYSLNQSLEWLPVRFLHGVRSEGQTDTVYSWLSGTLSLFSLDLVKNLDEILRFHTLKI